MAYLEIKNLSFSYKQDNNQTVIFNNLSFVFPSKGLFSIVGESGSGKSTLLNLIAQYLPTKEGKIIKDVPNTEIGFVFQSLYLIDHLSVEDNVALPLVLKGESFANARKKVVEIVKKVGMEQYLKRKINELSGGQQARVCLARGLISGGRLLLLDEPTGSLDSQNSEAIMELLEKLSEKCLIIVVTHNQELAKKYSNYVCKIYQKGLKIIYSKQKEEYKNVYQAIKKPSKEKKIKMKERIFLSFSFLKKRIKKLVLSLLFTTLAFTFVSMSIGLSQSGEEALLQLGKDSFDYSLIRLQEKKRYHIEGQDMELSKLVKISESTQKTLKNYDSSLEYYPSYEIVLPSVISLANNKEYLETKVYLSPCFPNEKLLLEGHVPSYYQEVVINQSLKDLLQGEIKLSAKLDSVITTTQYQTSVKDQINIDFNFEIAGVCIEKNLLPRPTIYYSYPLVSAQIGSRKLINASKMLNYDISIEDRLTYLSDENDQASGFKTLCYCKDPLELSNYIKENYDKEIVLTSYSLEITKSLVDIISSMSTIVTLFLVLAIISSFFLQLVIIENIYQEQKKELAIYLSFRISKNKFISLGVGQVVILEMLFLIMFVIFNFSFASLFNSLLSNYGLPRLFESFLGFPKFLALSGISFAFNYFCSILPLGKLYSKELVLSLKGE